MTLILTILPLIAKIKIRIISGKKYKEKKPLYVDPFDFQAHMFSIRWVIRLDHLLIFDRLMLTITVYVDRRESSGDVEIDKPNKFIRCFQQIVSSISSMNFSQLKQLKNKTSVLLV